MFNDPVGDPTFKRGEALLIELLLNESLSSNIIFAPFQDAQVKENEEVNEVNLICQIFN